MIQRHVSESQRTQESRQTQQTENMASQDQEAQGVISMTEGTSNAAPQQLESRKVANDSRFRAMS